MNAPAKPVKRRVETDTCGCCGSDDLFGGFFDTDDLAVPVDISDVPVKVPDGIRWTTFCNQCGTENLG